MSRIYLVRHGTTAYNKGGTGSDRIRSHRDVPLTDEGRQEGRELAHQFQFEPIVKIYTSDLSRSSDTAMMIASYQQKKPKVVKTKDLRSWDLGDLTGKITDKKTVEQIKHYVERDTEAVAGGESFRSFVGRVLACVEPVLAEAAKLPGEDCIAIVTHGRCVQIIDLWIEAGCDEECMHRDYADELSSEPDAVKPGGFLEMKYSKGRWRPAGESRMKLVSMKLSKGEAETMAPTTVSADKPAYPYGLRISLDKTALEKLGIDSEEDYEVDTECTIEARGVVVGYSMSKNQDGSESRNLEIQITELAVNPEAEADEDDGETDMGRAAYGRPSRYKG